MTLLIEGAGYFRMSTPAEQQATLGAFLYHPIGDQGPHDDQRTGCDSGSKHQPLVM